MLLYKDIYKSNVVSKMKIEAPLLKVDLKKISFQ